MTTPREDAIVALLDAVSGERADWRRVEVNPSDIVTALAEVRRAALDEAIAAFLAALHVHCQPSEPCVLPAGYEQAVIDALTRLRDGT